MGHVKKKVHLEFATMATYGLNRHEKKMASMRTAIDRLEEEVDNLHLKNMANEEQIRLAERDMRYWVNKIVTLLVALLSPNSETSETESKNCRTTKNPKRKR